MSVRFGIQADGGITLQTDRGLLPFTAWGFELGDWFSFYSSEPDYGKNFHVYDHFVDLDSKQRTIRYVVGLSKGVYRITGNDIVHARSIERSYTLEPLENSLLGDFVLRLGVPSQVFPRGRIAGRELEHVSENVYHEFFVNDAALTHQDRTWGIQSSSNPCFPSEGFIQGTYLRDEPSSTWILHHRLLSHSMDRIVWSISRWRFLLPRLAQRILSPISSKLWLRRERAGSASLLPMQTGSLTNVASGTRMKITAEVGIYLHE